MRGAIAVHLAAACAFVSAAAAAAERVTLSIVGTNDLHGRFMTDERGRGGLAVLGGYVDNLRAARAADGGGVLVLDAGDTFQGGIESNLAEGLMIVDAYNAIGYTALAVGNHDFDYGPVDPREPAALWLPRHVRGEPIGDVQGALKAAAARAHFPFLAANIVDAASGKPVSWPNVAPSALVEVAGVRVGLVGTITETGLKQTLAAHVVGLETRPLAPTIAAEARALRERGADIVVLATHAGGWCGETADPHDLASCDDGSEIFKLARELPRGTLQAIVAGHTHGTVAHFVNGVPIISVPNFGGQFGRVDLTVDTARREVASVRIHEPQAVCTRVEPRSGECAAAPGGVAAEYEGRPVIASAAVAAAIEPERKRVLALRAEPLGAVADAPLARGAGLDGTLGNLFAEALLAVVPDADVALGYGAGRGGLRADLAEGPVTFGQAYDVFPFDNRITRVALTGAQLTRVIAAQLPLWIDGRRGLPGLAGLRVTIDCSGAQAEVRLTRRMGGVVGADDPLVLAMASNTVGRFAATALPGEPEIVTAELPILVRDAFADWLLERGGHLAPAEVAGRWHLPPQGIRCGAPPE
ncbi:MAG TPA: 5'-nucleotidase C-terminal domain-containing protein [Gammaproteobacteria bacterium]|nr:5'-nucleotidase C-terminal domain-containing protein [Gammaproteobacteria bacterium]